MDLINAAFKYVKQLELLYGDSIPSGVIEEGKRGRSCFVHLRTKSGLDQRPHS